MEDRFEGVWRKFVEFVNAAEHGEMHPSAYPGATEIMDLRR